jgi:hypothetical protein
VRIRSTKPEFWRSRRIASVDWDARLVLKGLESYVDDNGVGKDDIELIVTDVFSRDLVRDTPGTVKKVSEAVRSLFRAGLLHRYEVDGTDYVYISWWDSNQYINKPNKGRFPRPDGTKEYGQSVIGSSIQKSPGNPGNPPVGTGEQRNRGTGEQTSSSEIAKAIPDEQRPEIEALCNRLADAIEANGVARPSFGKSWLTAARLLLDKDGYTVEQVEWMIDWATSDEFWRSNILSMPKLREKFPQLKLKAGVAVSSKPKHDPDWALA